MNNEQIKKIIEILIEKYEYAVKNGFIVQMQSIRKEIEEWERKLLE